MKSGHDGGYTLSGQILFCIRHGDDEMNETKLLLNAYYEVLHERLLAKKQALTRRIENLLSEEIEKRSFGRFDQEKYEAYRDACLAFVDERIEMYNPIGIQYTFASDRRQDAFALELQLDWYDSRAEFEALVKAARDLLEAPTATKETSQLADELIKRVGAFPDRSIISGYEAGPAPGKLPDYIVARATEEIVRLAI